MSFKVGNVEIGLHAPLFLMAGPCVIENQASCLDIASRLAQVARRTGVGVIFKASFDKANRSSISSFRGPGLDKGLRVLAAVRQETNLPVMTDVHEPAQAAIAGEIVDCLQVPAFLCRQTDLVCACARTAKPVNVKKGQFLSPMEMKNVVDKIRACGHQQIILTERGSCFGYRRLVVDMRSFPIMRSTGCPVIFDATHAVRLYGAPSSDPAGAEPQFVPTLARAAVAAGCDGVFIETHTNPQEAKCDACSMMPVDYLHDLLKELVAIREVLMDLVLGGRSDGGTYGERWEGARKKEKDSRGG